MKKTPSRLATFLIGILAAMTLTVVLIVAVMQPPLSDLVVLVLLLGLTSLGSGLIGFLSFRLGWWRRVRSLHLTLTLGYLVAVALTLLNVWLTARLMFINNHDLVLASLLLLFAGGISVSFGYFISGTITQTVHDLAEGAERLSQGDYSIRVRESGQDEVSRLAGAFNAMVRRLERLNEDERALDEARRNLVAWASHDLRTPLASLRAMLDALADGVVSDEKTVDRYLRQSRLELTHMSRLIDDLFEMAQLDAGRPDLVLEYSSLSDLISDTLGGFRARAESLGIELVGEVAPDVDPVWMAPEKISRVISNLVGNALRYTPPGGEIHLKAGVDNGWVTVIVEDTGTGIPLEDQPHVFERFYRSTQEHARDRREGRGAGLGLAIARGWVEAHEGEIRVQSRQPQGARFIFRLPREKHQRRIKED